MFFTGPLQANSCPNTPQPSKKNQFKTKKIMLKKIVIKGAREHNLKNISLEIPKDQFIVITGISG